MRINDFLTIEDKRMALAHWLAVQTKSSHSEMMDFAGCMSEGTQDEADYITGVARGYCALRDKVQLATCFDELTAIAKKVKGTTYEEPVTRLIAMKEHFLCQDENQPFPFYHNN